MKRCIPLLALGFAGVALAQEPLPPFEDSDSNQDGQISRTEAAAIEGLEFDTADSDQNGSLDRTEYMAAAREQGRGERSSEPGGTSESDPRSSGAETAEPQANDGRRAR